MRGRADVDGNALTSRDAENHAGHGGALLSMVCCRRTLQRIGGALRVTDAQSTGAASAVREAQAEGPTLTARRHAQPSCRSRGRNPRLGRVGDRGRCGEQVRDKAASDAPDHGRGPVERRLCRPRERPRPDGERRGPGKSVVAIAHIRVCAGHMTNAFVSTDRSEPRSSESEHLARGAPSVHVRRRLFWYIGPPNLPTGVVSRPSTPVNGWMLDPTVSYRPRREDSREQVSKAQSAKPSDRAECGSPDAALGARPEASAGS
jgi:hypothetical protein